MTPNCNLDPYSPDSRKITAHQIIDNFIDKIYAPNKKEKRILQYCETVREIIETIEDPNDIKAIRDSLDSLAKIKRKHPKVKEAYQITQQMTHQKHLELWESELKRLFEEINSPFHEMLSFHISDHLPKTLSNELKYVLLRKQSQETIADTVNVKSFSANEDYRNKLFSVKYYTTEGMLHLQEDIKRVGKEIRVNYTKLKIVRQGLEICYPKEAQQIHAMSQVSAKIEVLEEQLCRWSSFLEQLKEANPQMQSLPKEAESLSLHQWEKKLNREPLIITLWEETY